MKKITSLLLAILMLSTVLFSVPFTVNATSATDCTKVVYNVTNYSELMEAFADKDNDRTIILQNHIFESAVDSQRDIIINGSKTVVFDMNGYDISLYSSRTEFMFNILGTPKVHFFNSDPENSSEIYFDVNETPAIDDASIFYFDGAIGAKFYTYNINYYVGAFDLNDYIDEIGKDADFIESQVNINVMYIKEMDEIYLLGGNFTNYYRYGCGICTTRGAVCYELKLRGTDFLMGYSAFYFRDYSEINAKITEGMFKKIITDNGVPMFEYGDGYPELQSITGKNLMDDTPTLVEDMQGFEVTGETSLADITYNVEFITASTGQSFVDTIFITPNGHILIDYETGGFDRVFPHNIKEVGGFDATCTVEGKEPNKICSLCNYVQEEGKEIPATGHTTETVIHPATFNTNGTIEEVCVNCNTYVSETTIYGIDSVEFDKDVFVYNGKAVKPAVTVKDTEGNILVDGTDYIVEYDIGRKNVGEYEAVITFSTKYQGDIYKTFTIVPKSTKLKTVKPGKKSFTAKWKKQAKQTDGYEVQYSLKKNFKKAKTAEVKKNKTTKVTVKKLKAKKNYYVRIRTFKTVKGTKIYSEWSGSKTVKVK